MQLIVQYKKYTYYETYSYNQLHKGINKIYLIIHD